ncbi:NADPH:quinone oxidoreductase family protein [Amycolatopsis jejuensis]|uniref:NADPH:quinone oxidoreductase family protein n=1 Tax=Amycolatopsis jejuensis TaxID=330084 RepID=UPI000527C257|nr:NADPH:quinone oxidoreductase family protein [Amycolatopsis jejuensis]
MRAICVEEPDGPASARVRDVAAPERGRGEVLVEVHYVAAGFPDLLMAQGLYHQQPEAPFVLGSDFSGIVLEAPAGSGLRENDRIAGFLDSGAAAEVVTVPVTQVYPLPDGVSLGDGAALPMNYLTAHFALAVRGNLAPGETVLIHGAAGGVGTACIQVARGLGARTIGVVSSEAKARIAGQAGADHVLRREQIPAVPREITNGRGVDVVIDVVGGEVVTDSLRSLAPMGRLMVVGFTSGEIPRVKVNRLLMNNTDIRGVEQSYMIEHGRSQEQWAVLTGLIRNGTISPIIHSVRPLKEYSSALREMAERRLLGRAVFAVR